MNSPYRKKLIEVALPLEAINRESAREKSIRHGHPSTLHLWWARRPLAAARAVLFAQLVDDPSAWPERFPTEEAQARERKRLFALIEELVTWEASSSEAVIGRARLEIAQSWARSHPSSRATQVLSFSVENFARPEQRAIVDEYLSTKVPPVHDPFAGGGTIPLEAQRLGLRAIASDLNPVAVLINKALLEVAPRFSGRAPVHPDARAASGRPPKRAKRAVQPELSARRWKGAQGLAEDVTYYGTRIRDEAIKRIGGFYPSIVVTPDMATSRDDLKNLVGEQLTVIAWLWTRTVESPDPAFAGVHVPLISSYWLSTKEGNETWIEPIVDGRTYRFAVRRGVPTDRQLIDSGTKFGRGGFRCLLSGSTISFEHIRTEGLNGRLRERMLAIVGEGKRRRIYLPPDEASESTARSARPESSPEGELPEAALGFRIQNYGLKRWEELFTARQLLGLDTFSKLTLDIRAEVLADALSAGMSDDGTPLRAGGKGAVAYSDAIALLLAFVLSKSVDGSSTLCRWMIQRDSLFSTYSRQALPMTWDYAEVNLLADCTRSFSESIAWTAESIAALGWLHVPEGRAEIEDAMSARHGEARIFSADPPYYDNIGYADLSDFFYIWLRRTLRDIFPDETNTLLVPKRDELVATPFRHGGRDGAERFFVDGMTRALSALAASSMHDVPTTIYYAFKQSELTDEGRASTGWETFLEAVLRSGFEIHGTWPVRTERSGRSRDIGSNALATSVVLALVRREPGAGSIARAEFRRLLRSELPSSLRALQHAGIAPVDVAQAAIGPGMSVFSRFDKVLEPDGTEMTVRAALQLVNEILDEHLTEQEGDFDSDTRFAVTWYEVYGFDAGPYGEAETLAKARAVAVQGIADAGIIRSGGGKVRLLKRAELACDWDPAQDKRLTVWEATQHLIKRLEEQGEEAAATLLDELGATADAARDLAYRLFSACEQRGWSEEARAYNSLVSAWSDLEKLAVSRGAAPAQQELL